MTGHQGYTLDDIRNGRVPADALATDDGASDAWFDRWHGTTPGILALEATIVRMADDAEGDR